MHQGIGRYVSYLLRIWHARELYDTWRVSLENAQTHELRGFANLEEVFEFLNREVESYRNSVDVGTRDCLKEEEEGDA